MDLKEEYKLRRIVHELKNKRGRHTELVSVYIPSGFNINHVMSQLSDEQGTASNIKSKANRKNVVDALERIIQHLRLFKQTPENGFAVFCGNVSEREGVQDLKLWSVEPFEPIHVRIYRCDQVFVTQPLEELVVPKDIYALIAIDNKDATIATLRGDRYNIVKKLSSGYHGKHRAGGQSQRRFERIVLEQSHDFKMRVGDAATRAFLDNLKNLRGIVIGGPAGTKDDFVEGDFLHHELKKKIISVQDITYTDESGIRELIGKSHEVLSNVQMVRQKGIMQRFMKELVHDGNIIYGDDTEKALDAGAAEVLLLSENLDDETIDNLYDKAKTMNTKVEIVPDSFEEGFQLWNTFGGRAALLRFKI